MAEGDRGEVAQATVVSRKSSRISMVWIIPIIAAVVAVGIAVERILTEGPTITITFFSHVVPALSCRSPRSGAGRMTPPRSS